MAVAAVAVPVLLHGEPRVIVGSPTVISTAPRTSAPRYPWPPAGSHPRTVDTTQLNSLTTTWTHELRHVFPTLVPEARGVSVQQWDHQATDATPTKRNFTDTMVRFTVHGAATAVSIEVYAPGADSTGPNARCAATSSHSLASSAQPPPGVTVPPDTCGISLRGDSALVRETTTASVPDASKPGATLPTMQSVTQFRADGSVVSATAYNYDPAGGVGSTMTHPPLTTTQLTTLATDPDLGF